MAFKYNPSTKTIEESLFGEWGTYEEALEKSILRYGYELSGFEDASKLVRCLPIKVKTFFLNKKNIQHELSKYMKTLESQLKISLDYTKEDWLSKLSYVLSKDIQNVDLFSFAFSRNSITIINATRNIGYGIVFGSLKQYKGHILKIKNALPQLIYPLSILIEDESYAQGINGKRHLDYIEILKTETSTKFAMFYSNHPISLFDENMEIFISQKMITKGREVNLVHYSKQKNFYFPKRLKNSNLFMIRKGLLDNILPKYLEDRRLLGISS